MARTLFFDDRTWTNWHLSVRDVPVAGRFELHNSSGRATLEKMAASAAAVQALIDRAFRERRRLRAQGSAWSFSDAPVAAGGWSLSTGYANWLFPLPESHVHVDHVGDRQGMVLCQTGISISELNMYLEGQGRSLATSGASNGQTFVGAMSTGTHGSAVDQPAIQGQVAAIQLIPAPDQNLWIEPESNPVTDGRVAEQLGATMIRSDALFAAALVSLGALGIVHSVLVKSVPLFLLETNRDRVPLSTGVRSAMSGGGFDQADLPGPSGRPYFFQAVVNQHIDAGHAYLTVGHKRPWDPSHELRYDRQNQRGPGYNLGVIVANLLTAFPGLTPPLTKAVLADQLKPISGLRATWGQSFNFTTPRAGTCGSATAVPADRTLEVLDIYQRALRSVGHAPVAFACRYAVKSPGHLAFVRHDQTAIVDIDGIDNRAARAVMVRAIADLRGAGIPHAEHWGKLNQMTASSVRDSYRSELETWMRVRTDLLDRTGEYIFGSPFLDRLGMTSATF